MIRVEACIDTSLYKRDERRDNLVENLLHVNLELHFTIPEDMWVSTGMGLEIDNLRPYGYGNLYFVF